MPTETENCRDSDMRRTFEQIINKQQNGQNISSFKNKSFFLENSTNIHRY